MIRARWCLLLPLSLAACDRPTTTTPSDAAQPKAGDDAQPLVSGDTVAIVAVPQRSPSIDVSSWRFDPSGRWMAEEFTDDELGLTACGIWDIESGSFLREHVYADDDAQDGVDPCVAWDADPRAHAEVSADGKLRASVVGKLAIEQIGGATRTVDGCVSCGDAMVWAPSGHQLATCNGRLLEIWDADTGKRVRSATLGLPDVEEVLLGWTEQGLGVVVMHEVSAPCSELEPDGSFCDWEVEYDDEGEPLDDPGPIEGVALSSFWWPADGGPPVTNLQAYASVDTPSVYADAGVRWFAFEKEISYDRDGSSTTVHVLGVGPRASALGFTELDDDEDWIERWNGHWRVDATTHWIEGVTVTSGDSDYYELMQVGWNAIVAEPNPTAFHGQEGELEGLAPSGDIEVFAAFSGAALTRWEACIDDGGEEPCQSGSLPIGDCELLDVSPMLSVALVDCDGALKMIEAAGRGATVAALPQDPASTWRWGRSNWLALLEPDGALSVIDVGTGKTLYERDDVLDLGEVPLAAEQDRLALGYADRVEIVVGKTGKRVIALPGDWLAVALSPDGKQVAAIESQQLQVIDIESGKVITTAPVDDAYGVAWRQDGAALFYGYDWPTHAIDPKTGKLLYELDDPVLDVLASEEIDPSWRWIHRPDGSVIRTLDFQRLELGASWARIASGMFDGELADLPDNLRFRVGDDADAPAIHTVAELEPWLRSPGLVEAFFAGKPLPSPRLPISQLGARGAMRRVASLGLFAEGGVAESSQYPDTASFRLLALDENPSARRRAGLHHGLLGKLEKRKG